MDPRANITEQVRIAKNIIGDLDDGLTISRDAIERLAELVLTLDDWQRKGGFSPYQR